MAVLTILKCKIKASSLTEVIVATTLVLVVFGMSIAVLNNILSGITKFNTHTIDTKLNELHYLYVNNKIKLPFYEKEDNWEIEITNMQKETNTFIVFKAIHDKTKKTRIKTIFTLETY